ncbi:site-specific integrase [Domibacillus sp. PGB-M46]|uniref:site-specific integrase n=1 Tax=Domibacillus sp. PGB-M46 TaxID=2910255 RepID=UPI002814A012|nr:site-specific integrase [Domibacillus sp. PGB-M46]
MAEAKQLDSQTNYTMILLLAYTGLRLGESLGLTWYDIDFEKKTLTVNKTRDRYGTRTPKTKRSYRTILVDDFLLQHLAAYRTWCMKTKFRYGLHLKNDDFIFISPISRKPVSDHTLQYCFRSLCKKTGLKQVSPHGLRLTLRLF